MHHQTQQKAYGKVSKKAYRKLAKGLQKNQHPSHLAYTKISQHKDKPLTKAKRRALKLTQFFPSLLLTVCKFFLYLNRGAKLPTVGVPWIRGQLKRFGKLPKVLFKFKSTKLTTRLGLKIL